MRSHYCGDVNETLVGQTVTVAGWMHRRRDHGGVIFIDFRDREGLVQIVCNPEDADSFAIAERVRSEYVLQVEGEVRLRPEGSDNNDLKSGKIEIVAKRIEILNSSETPPFPLSEQAEVSEDAAEQLLLSQQIKTLTLPSEMGERFKVMSLTRDYDEPLMGFAMQDLRNRW